MPKISELPPASTANPTDQLEINQAGESKRVTVDQLLDVTGGAYLPLAGGTLTGPLTGTLATFSADVSATEYQFNNVPVVKQYFAGFTGIGDPVGSVGGLHVGAAANYHHNTSHILQGPAGTPTFVDINAGGANFLIPLNGTTATFSERITRSGADNDVSVLIAGATNAIRMGMGAGGSSIQGVDNTGTGSFQPLTLGGTVINLECPLTGTTATFSGNMTAGGYVVQSSTVNTRVLFNNQVNAADLKKWAFTDFSDGNFYLQSMNDVDVPTSTWSFKRDGSTTLPGGLSPTGDNAYALGGASNRWSVVYAASGAINTSGRDEKAEISDPSDAERRAAARIKAIGPKRFKFRNAVETKGDGARWHFGYIAEDVRDALAAEGLDPWSYGLLCADPVTTTEATSDDPMDRTRTAPVLLLDDQGAAVMRLGLRYDELLCFLHCAE